MIGKFKENKKFRKAGKMLLTDPLQIDGQQKSEWEENKKPARTEIINFLLSLLNRETTYLEIGVRNPDDNFNHIKANIKYSVDPGLEFKSNPADFKMTSDDFFEKMEKGEVLSGNIKFDLIFVDGLHLAEQADKDIKNAERYIKEDGFIVVHDCNPPTEWHAREEFGYKHSPAEIYWNGTTWKAFLKWRFNPSFNSCCVDTDWGVGILSKKWPLGKSIQETNPFFEYSIFSKNRKEYLNLISFDDLKKKLMNSDS